MKTIRRTSLLLLLPHCLLLRSRCFGPARLRESAEKPAACCLRATEPRPASHRTRSDCPAWTVYFKRLGEDSTPELSVMVSARNHSLRAIWMADGDLDILVGDSFFGSTGISVLKNNGDQTFAAPVYYSLPQSQTVGEVALSDFDFDGDLDAFATIRGDSDQLTKIMVWRNNGDGTFAASD